MTVVTQFLTTDGTDEGDFSEMRRHYIQDGKIVYSPPFTILGLGKKAIQSLISSTMTRRTSFEMSGTTKSTEG